MLKNLINRIDNYKYVLFFIILFAIVYRDTLLLNFQQDEYHSIIRIISQHEDVGLLKLIFYNLQFLPINEISYLFFTLIFKGNHYYYNLLNFFLININILIIYNILSIFSKKEFLKVTVLGIIFFNYISYQIFLWNWAGISYNLGLIFISLGYLLILKNKKILIGITLITLSALIRPFFIFCFPAVLIYLFLNKKKITLIIFFIIQLLIIYLNLFFDLKLYDNLKSFDTISDSDVSRLYLGYSDLFFVRPLIHIGQLFLFNQYYWHFDFNQFVAITIIFLSFVYIKKNEISYFKNILILAISLLTYFILFNFDFFAKDHIYLESRHYFIPAIFLGIILFLIFENLSITIRKFFIIISLIVTLFSVINLTSEISKLKNILDYKVVLIKEIINELDLNNNNVIIIDEKNSSTSYNRFSYNTQTGIIFPIILELFNDNKIIKNSIYDKKAWSPDFEGFIDLDSKKLGVFFSFEKMYKNLKSNLIEEYNLVHIEIDYKREYEVDYTKTDLENTRLNFIF